MRARAFTLVELLVVVAIVALLVAVAVPSLSMARSLAWATKCRGNLRHIGAGLQAAANISALPADVRLFPEPDDWPAIPMNVLPDKRTYQCSGETLVYHELGEYTIHTNNGNIEIPFAENRESGLCRVIEEDNKSILYGFDDGSLLNLWTALADIRIRVYKTVPRRVVNETETYQGAKTGVLSLHRGGEVVPGWEDFRDVPFGEPFTMASGNSSYGYNARAYAAELPTDTVVVMDYPSRLANTPSDAIDLSANLVHAAQRHNGRLNLLFADLSVKPMTPLQIDPKTSAVNARRWTPNP